MKDRIKILYQENKIAVIENGCEHIKVFDSSDRYIGHLDDDKIKEIYDKNKKLYCHKEDKKWVID